MSWGAIIAIGFWSILIAISLKSCWRSRHKRQPEVEYLFLVVNPFTEAELEEIERMRSGAAYAEAMASTLEDIHSLPEAER